MFANASRGRQLGCACRTAVYGRPEALADRCSAHPTPPLQEDILAEAVSFGNRILVKHENEDLSLYDHWEPVTPADVQTPQEVYAELRGEALCVWGGGGWGGE